MKKILILTISLAFLFVAMPVIASPTVNSEGKIKNGEPCLNPDGTPMIVDGIRLVCEDGTRCKASRSEGKEAFCTANTDSGGGSSAVDAVFGKIVAPTPIANIGYGNAGLSKFLTNVVSLIYIAAGIAFLFMIIWAGMQIILNAGDKEALGKARTRIIYSIIGIILMALAFLIIRVIGQITGFSFFAGQNATVLQPQTQKNVQTDDSRISPLNK